MFRPFIIGQAMISRTTFPWTSVNLMSRPPKRKVDRV
jgi:hypothetical protein